MPPKEIWADFVSTGVVRHLSKHGNHEEDYDTWKCPHCDGTVEMVVSTQNRKAMACAAHFWNTRAPCRNRPEGDLRGKKGPKKDQGAAAAAEPPVVGQPLEAQNAGLQQELSRVRLELERERITSERYRQDRDASEIRLNEERILSERLGQALDSERIIGERHRQARYASDMVLNQERVVSEQRRQELYTERTVSEQHLRNQEARGEQHRGQLALPVNEGDFCRRFLRQAIASDALLRQMSPSKRVAMQLLDLYAQTGSPAEDQFELFKKAYNTMPAQSAMAVVRRFYGETTDATLERAAAQLNTLEASMPELETEKRSERADEALCLFHLQNVCRRVGFKPLTRAGFAALHLAEYDEIRTRFANRVRVTTDEIRCFLQNEPEGRAFWLALCARCGLPMEPYNADKYQVEHIKNVGWGGTDHYINFMILPKLLNNAAEFRYGPGEVKMITLTLPKYQLVQRFARWRIGNKEKHVPGDAFWKIESEAYALPPINISTGERHLRATTLGKRQRTGDTVALRAMRRLCVLPDTSDSDGANA